MKNPSPGHPSRIMWFLDKASCILFGVFLVLAGLELFLRLLGFGYNIIYKAPVDKGAEYRIYCVGESTTWGVGASDPISKGYPRRLEEMLNNKYKGMKIQCFFDQTIGQNTSEILAKFPLHISKYRPQLVIFLVGVNNWWNMDRSNILLFNKRPWISQLSLKVLIFLDQFRVWKLFKNMAFPLRPSQERWDYFNARAGRAPEESGEQRWNKDPIFDELAEHDIGSMVKICKVNGIKVIMSTYPVVARDLRRVQINTAKKYDLLLVDHYEVFQKLKDPQAHLSAEDHWHPNDAGYEVVAENIYNCIVKNKLIEPQEKESPR